MGRFGRTSMLIVLFLVALSPLGFATEESEESHLVAETFSGLKLRGIGPAFMSGRIADVAKNPTDKSTWYVAVASGGVWKTVNSGTTWERERTCERTCRPGLFFGE